MSDPEPALSSERMPEKPQQTTSEDDDRLVIPLDPEVAVAALLKVDPKQMPPEDDEDDQPRVGDA
jgi:hypothetical protein